LRQAGIASCDKGVHEKIKRNVKQPNNAHHQNKVIVRLLKIAMLLSWLNIRNKLKLLFSVKT
jgi:hypothetical protein